MTTLRLVPQTVPATDATPARKRPRAPARNPHRGVFLMPPDPPKQPRWRARYTDPETGKLTRVALAADAEGKNADTRRDYAIKVHKRITARRDEIRAGARPHAFADMTIEAALAKYFETHGARKRKGTVGNYRSTCDMFLEWCALPAVAIRTVRQLSKGHFAAFVAWRATSEVKASTVNRDIKNLSAVLNKLRKAEVIRVTRDDISDGLEKLDAAHERREFLRVAELAALVEACRKHDAARPGEPPALPLVLFVLLTGLRVSEALGIEWRDVGVDEIDVRSEVSKTKRARAIDLVCSPVLTALVSERANHRPHDLVLSGWSKADIHDLRKRLVAEYGAPRFTSQALRCTCGTFLTCAPAIFGASSAYQSAKRLGHSVAIAEKHYTGVVRVPVDATTIEAAMRLDVTPASCPRL